ncbi:hypothetical protein GCM10011289_05680 [Paludibacterium paludis]|uniref:Uncharacterized protein n=2 Tax=Paludibacterium paludis TaxID=1225769 RepID=A0A918NYL9_9NEIS|nr:hypothetical protein GCM10011289_05680 [Paludibacterium paludis]
METLFSRLTEGGGDCDQNRLLDFSEEIAAKMESACRALSALRPSAMARLRGGFSLLTSRDNALLVEHIDLSLQKVRERADAAAQENWRCLSAEG